MVSVPTTFAGTVRPSLKVTVMRRRWAGDGDDVVVGEDVAVRPDDHAGAGAASWLGDVHRTTLLGAVAAAASTVPVVLAAVGASPVSGVTPALVTVVPSRSSAATTPPPARPPRTAVIAATAMSRRPPRRGCPVGTAEPGPAGAAYGQGDPGGSAPDSGCASCGPAPDAAPPPQDPAPAVPGPPADCQPGSG